MNTPPPDDALEELRAAVRAVIEARDGGDFAPLLPKLRSLLASEADAR